MPLRASAQIGRQRRIAAELAGQGKMPDDAVAPRDLAIDAAQRLAVEARDRAELEVDVEIKVLGLALGVGFLAGDRRFEEAAAVEHVAPHRYFHDTVGGAL